MTTRLHACSECRRHIRVDVPLCPFCDTALPNSFAGSPPVPPAPGLSRGQLHRYRALGFASIGAVGAVASAASVVSCGSSYGSPPFGPYEDAGLDVSSHDAADEHHDATVPTDASSDVTRADAHVEAQVDGPCNFATFVIDLIEHQTTPTALPSANLGQSCTDDENPAEFAILFQ